VTSLNEDGTRFLRFNAEKGTAMIGQRVTVKPGAKLRLLFKARVMNLVPDERSWYCPRFLVSWTGDATNLHHGFWNFWEASRTWDTAHIDIPNHPGATEVTVNLGVYHCTGTLDVAWVRLLVE
jgi:hypothetical protein